jgi:DNA gyrase/topoisomerase IV subunit A
MFKALPIAICRPPPQKNNLNIPVKDSYSLKRFVYIMNRVVERRSDYMLKLVDERIKLLTVIKLGKEKQNAARCRT